MLAALLSWGIALFEYLIQAPTKWAGLCKAGAVYFMFRSYCHKILRLYLIIIFSVWVAFPEYPILTR
jgi:hypothetical protein